MGVIFGHKLIFLTNKVSKELVKCYEEIRVAVAVGGDTLDVWACDGLCVQNSLPAEPPEIDVSDTELVTALVKSLISIRNHCDAGL